MTGRRAGLGLNTALMLATRLRCPLSTQSGHLQGGLAAVGSPHEGRHSVLVKLGGRTLTHVIR